MQSTVRGRPRSAEADRAITDAVLGLLAEVPFADITMAGVAARAGVSTATLYRRYASKEALVVDAIDAEVDRDDPPDTGTLDGDLRSFLRRAVSRMSDTRRGVFLALSGELARHPLLAAEVRERLTKPATERVRVMIERAVARKEIPPVADMDLAIAVIIGPLHYRMVVTGEPLTSRVADRLAALAMRALGCPSA